MKNIGIILAGGLGSRFNPEIPKQFVKVAGKTVIEHTLDVFQNHSRIDEICIVIKSEFLWKMEDIVNTSNYSKVKKIVAGGKERRDSSLSAINSYSDENDEVNLIFHDAVRPFVRPQIIDNCIDSLQQFDAVDVAIKTVDTIIKAKGNRIDKIPKRSNMMQGQTPQAFKLKTIKQAYDLALADQDFIATDDCGVVKKYLPETTIHIVEGSVENIKITHKQDIFTADKLFQIKMQEMDFIHSAEYYKEKLTGKVMVVFGGSYGIGSEIADTAEAYGCIVHRFSRTKTNTDVSQIEDVKRDLNYVNEKEGKIDMVVNTASILIKEPLSHTPIEDIVKSSNINYLGSIFVAKESLQYLKKTNGQLLNFTSSSYTRGRENYSLYSSSKAAIVNLVQALASEWMYENVRINCLNPERTMTPMRTKSFGIEDASTLLSPEQVAYSSLNTLLSSLTGQIVDVRLRKTNLESRIIERQ